MALLGLPDYKFHLMINVCELKLIFFAVKCCLVEVCYRPRDLAYTIMISAVCLHRWNQSPELSGPSPSNIADNGGPLPTTCSSYTNFVRLI